MKTVIEMAREAGLAFASEEFPDIWNTYINPGRTEIERFAALVREDERERNGRGDYMEGLEEGYAAGQRDEREKLKKLFSVATPKSTWTTDRIIAEIEGLK